MEYQYQKDLPPGTAEDNANFISTTTDEFWVKPWRITDAVVPHEIINIPVEAPSHKQDESYQEKRLDNVGTGTNNYAFWQMIFSGGLLIVAALTVIVAYLSARRQRLSAETQSGAWVGVRDFTNSPDNDAITVVIQNCGQTPALDVEVYATHHFGDIDLDIDMPRLFAGIRHWKRIGTLWQNQTYEHNVLFSETNLPEALDSYYIFGAITCRDIFGTERQNLFANDFTPGNALRQWNFRNNVDFSRYKTVKHGDNLEMHDSKLRKQNKFYLLWRRLWK